MTNSPFRLYSIVLLLLLGMGQAMAQIDTLITTSGERLPVTIRSLPSGDDFGKVLRPGDFSIKLSADYISSFHFFDGFHLDYKDGTFLRDNLLLCPTMAYRGDGIWAEGLARLTRQETRSLLGENIYCRSYNPSRALFWTGIAQSAVSFPFSLWLWVPTSRLLQKDYREWSAGDERVLAGTTYTTSATLVGLASVIISSLEIRDLKETSVGRAWAEVGAGTATLAAGIALASVGMKDLRTHAYWQVRGDWKVHIPSTEPPSPASPWLVAGGTALISIALPLLVTGAFRLYGFHRTPSGLAFVF